MKYRLAGPQWIGRFGPALGTLTFGQETDEEGSFAQLDRFTEVGGSLIDAADVYVGGRSEEIIGRWLSQRPGVRDSVVIATKGRFRLAPARTATACPGSTWPGPSTARCGTCRSTRSTCTSCTAGTR